MRYCVNCGNQLEDGAAFCPKCGSAQGEGNSPANYAQGGTGTAHEDYKPSHGTGNYGNKMSAENIKQTINKLSLYEKVIYIGFIVAYISLFLPHIGFSALGYSQSASFARTGGWVFGISILLILAGAAVVVVGKFFMPLDKKYIFYAGIGQAATAVLYIIWWIAIAVRLGEYSDYSVYGLGVNIGPSVGAVFYIAGLAAVIAGTVLRRKNNEL